MTLIDALAALQEGAVPTNDQLTVFLTRLLAAFPPEDKLSRSGKGLVSDSKAVVESLVQIVEHRNGGEELQEFLWRSRGTAGQLGKKGLKLRWGKGADDKKDTSLEKPIGVTKSEEKGVGKRTERLAKSVKSDAIQAAQHLRTILRLALVQPELRHIVADVGYMFAEVVDKSTGTSIEEARIQLGQVKSATGTFQNVATKALNSVNAQKQAIQRNGITGSVDDIRVDALKQLAAGAASGMPALSALRDQLSATFSEGSISLETIRNELSNGRAVPALEELRRQAYLSAGQISKGKEDLERLRGEIAEGKLPPEVLAALAGGDGDAPRLAENHNEAEIPNVNGDALLSPTDLLDAAQMIAVANQKFKLAPASTIKDVAKATAENAKVNMKEAWTIERQERLMRRVQKLIVDCQVSKEYKEAIEWFIGKIEASFSAVQGKLELPTTSLDEALSSAAEPLIQLVENFAAGRSLRSILKTVKALSIGAKNDADIVAFWKDADRHLRRCLLEEGFILTKDADDGLQQLVKRFHGLQENYKSNIAKAVRETAAFVDAITHDDLLRSFVKHTKDVLADLTFSSKGDAQFPSRALLQDLWLYILPPLFDRFGVVPVPRIKYLHPDFDLVIENIALELKHLLPDIFDMRMTNDVHLDFRKIKDSTHAHSLKIKIKGMSIRVYKLAFAVTSRMGFTFHDHGIADLLVADFGLSIYIDVPKDPGPHYFIVKKVKAKLGTLKLKIHKSNHRILHSVAGGLANSYMAKRILRHFIALGITAGLKQLDVQLMAMRLNKDSEQGKISVQEVKRQMAELRDLLKKYNEMAGTVEIDFTRDEGVDVGRSIEDSHAVRWVKKQVEQTGTEEIVRNDWRSNAFDLSGEETTFSAKKVEVAAQNVDKPVEESRKAAEIRQKPEGPTDESIVRKASEELQRAEEDESRKREALQNRKGMESAVGKEAVTKTDQRGDQASKLEAAVESNS